MSCGYKMGTLEKQCQSPLIYLAKGTPKMSQNKNKKTVIRLLNGVFMVNSLRIIQ